MLPPAVRVQCVNGIHVRICIVKLQLVYFFTCQHIVEYRILMGAQTAVVTQVVLFVQFFFIIGGGNGEGITGLFKPCNLFAHLSKNFELVHHTGAGDADNIKVVPVNLVLNDVGNKIS